MFVKTNNHRPILETILRVYFRQSWTCSGLVKSFSGEQQKQKAGVAFWDLKRDKLRLLNTKICILDVSDTQLH